MVVINTNITALIGQNNLSKSQSALQISMERLSSGLRINSAKDDAAGLGIANRMEANLRADSQIRRGINDGIGLIQTAEGGLDSINDLLQRSRQLAVQAANGTLSDADRAAINLEYHSLRDEIDRIAKNTEIFGKHPLAPAEMPPPETKLGDTPNIKETFPSSGTSIKEKTSSLVPLGFIPEGATGVTITIDSYKKDDDIQIFTRSGKHLIGTPIEDSAEGGKDFVWSENNVDVAELEERIFTEENGFLPGAKYDAQDLLQSSGYDPESGDTNYHEGMRLTYSGDGDRFDNGKNNGVTNSTQERLYINKTTEPLFLLVVGEAHNGYFDATVTWENMPDTVTPPPEPTPASSATDIVMNANYGDDIKKVTIEPTPADSVSLGMKTIELDPAEEAVAALAKLDAALAKVDGYRSQYGAMHNRLEGAIENLGQKQVSTAAARSRIMDADYAVEVADMTKAQILQQASNSLLAQANQLPQSVLTLLG